ncbi:hypothetical protein L6452_08486 [Arctium lappa]|uniref:Uncharacterized protein n=1 Tax=Arctium lappa TaxID=4217 RepID=A0ACB9DIF4_ARCLA|nr:hypothetical protein L6452_08486 [Arctium lappa]
MLVYAIWHYAIAYIEVWHKGWSKILWRDKRQVFCIPGWQTWKLMICDERKDKEFYLVIERQKHGFEIHYQVALFEVDESEELALSGKCKKESKKDW